MNYSVVLTEQSRAHIRYLLRQGVMNRGEQVRLINAMAARLQYQPSIARGSAKVLRQPNVLLASYELRVQPWRVFYNVDNSVKEVRVEAIGYKVREKLLIEGKEVKL
jgi:hypothetical protein